MQVLGASRPDRDAFTVLLWIQGTGGLLFHRDLQVLSKEAGLLEKGVHTSADNADVWVQALKETINSFHKGVGLSKCRVFHNAGILGADSLVLCSPWRWFHSLDSGNLGVLMHSAKYWTFFPSPNVCFSSEREIKLERQDPASSLHHMSLTFPKHLCPSAPGANCSHKWDF